MGAINKAIGRLGEYSLNAVGGFLGLDGRGSPHYGGVPDSVDSLNPHIDEEFSMKSDIVYRCVDIISSQISYLPLQVVSNDPMGNPIPMVGHEMEMRLHRPNRRVLESEFKRFLLRSLLLHGNAFVEVVRDGDRITGLFPIHPDCVSTKLLSATDMEYTVTVVGRNGFPTTKVLREDEILHIRGPNSNPMTGMGVSVLEYAAQTINVSLDQERTAGLLFRNRIQPGAVITTEMGADALEPTQEEALHKALQQARMRPHSTVNLPPGRKWDQITMTPNDAQFIQSRQLTREMVSNFYGVPTFMLNMTEKSTSWGTGIEQQGIIFLRNTLMGWIVVVEEGLTRSLLHGRSVTDEYFRFNTASLTRADKKTRYETYAIALSHGVLNPNEVRAEEGRPPYEGGEEYHFSPGTAMRDRNGDGNASGQNGS